MYLAGLNPIAPEQMSLFYETLDLTLFSAASDFSYLFEPLPIETQLGERSTDDGATTFTAGSSPITPASPSVPSLPLVTFDPPRWYEIPQGRYKYGKKQWSYSPLEPVFFQVDGFPGINMGDAFRKRFAGLKGMDDLVLQNMKKAISCRFLFPGYPPNKSPQIFTMCWNKGRDPITRSKLAYHIARKLKLYLDTMRRSHVMDPSTDQRWEIGEGFMFLNNMYLSKLESVSVGSFQPQVWVVDPAV